MKRSEQNPLRSSPELRSRVWQAYSRAVADLHRRNILRADLDDVNSLIYNPTTAKVVFQSAAENVVTRRQQATPEELAHNLVPLMQFVLTNKKLENAEGTWEAFEQVYKGAMDERGVEVVALLRRARTELQEAARLNIQALGLAYLGKLEQAVEAFRRAARIRESLSDYDGCCRVLCNLALVYADRRDMAQAHATVDRAVEKAREHGRLRAWSLALLQKSLLLNRQYDRAGASQVADEALAVWEKTGWPVPDQFAALRQSLQELANADRVDEGGEKVDGEQV